MFMTNNPKVLSEVFTIISKINAETNFMIKNDHLLFNVTSKCNTNFSSIKLLKNVFSKYEYKEDVSFGFSTKHLEEIMKKAKEDDTIYISFNDDYTKLKITFTNDKRKINYEIGLMETITEGFKELPTMEHDTAITAENKTVLESLNCLIFSSDRISEGSVMFKVSDKDFMVTESGDDSIGKATVTLKDFTGDSIKKTVEAKFCKKMVTDLVSHASKIADKSIYHFKNDCPIKIVTDTAEVNMVSFLAPRVSND